MYIFIFYLKTISGNFWSWSIKSILAIWAHCISQTRACLTTNHCGCAAVYLHIYIEYLLRSKYRYYTYQLIKYSHIKLWHSLQNIIYNWTIENYIIIWYFKQISHILSRFCRLFSVVWRDFMKLAVYIQYTTHLHNPS